MHVHIQNLMVDASFKVLLNFTWDFCSIAASCFYSPSGTALFLSLVSKSFQFILPSSVYNNGKLCDSYKECHHVPYKLGEVKKKEYA